MAQSQDDQSNGAAVSDHFVESLERLSKKNGVLATIVIDRTNGVILNTSGSLLSIRASPTTESPSLSEEASADLADESGMNDMARMVWNYVAATRELVQGLDTQDELKFLRLRTKKYELVIVPDPKYLLVVVHDMPSA